MHLKTFIVCHLWNHLRVNRVRYILTEDEYSLAGTLSTVRMQKKKKKDSKCRRKCSIQNRRKFLTMWH